MAERQGGRDEGVRREGEEKRGDRGEKGTILRLRGKVTDWANGWEKKNRGGNKQRGTGNETGGGGEAMQNVGTLQFVPNARLAISISVSVFLSL